MTGKTLTIDTFENLDALKSAGSYLCVKKNIETTLGIKLGVKGWDSLFGKLCLLKKTINSQPMQPEQSLSSLPLNTLKQRVWQLLQIKIAARTKSEYLASLKRLWRFFLIEKFDPFKRFEEIKRRNFIESSKLEQLDLSDVQPFSSVQEVVKKYKRG